MDVLIAVAPQQPTISHLLFHQGIFYQNYRTVVPHPLYFSLFPQLKICVKLKGCHFDTTQAIEAESQAVLNALTKNYFQDEFTKW
jgi:hypothetical protein